MCGRYANHLDSLRGWTVLLDEMPAHAPTSYNVAPSQDAPIVTSAGWHVMNWGLVPHWSPEPRTRYSTINARAESLVRSPAYRDAWRRGQRCLVPSLGYYEWRQSHVGKQPFFIHHQHGEPLMLAGLWECWRGEGEEKLTYSIVTVAALPELEFIHPRNPLMLSLDAGRDWLHAGNEFCAERLQPQSMGALAAYPVAHAVNNPRNEGPELIEPLNKPVV